MRREIEQREPERDPALETALRQTYDAAPASRERLDLLRARIRQRAEALVAADDAATPVQASWRSRLAWPDLRRFPVRRAYLWAPPALLAAAVAGILLLGRDAPTPAPAAPATILAVGYATPEQALTSTVSDAEFARTVTEGNDPAALLAIAVAPESTTP